MEGVTATDVLRTVYLLWHMNPAQDGETDDKLLGVYATRQNAEHRRDAAKSLQGFEDHPDAFVISEYAVDQDEWTEGFVVIPAAGK